MLNDIRKIISKYNFPPELINKIELVSCDIYDLIIKEKQRRTEIKDFLVGEEAEKRDVIARADRLRCNLSISIKEMPVGGKIFVPFNSFNKNKEKFAAYVHPISRLHSVVTTKQVAGGWIITKLEVIK